MQICIVGAGRMGFNLAQRFDEEGHAVTVLDRDPRNVERARTRLDVMTVAGSGSSLRDLRVAGAETADLLVAASGSDEVNIVSCLLARQLGVHRRIARVESDELLADLDQTDREVLGVSEFINPARVAVDRLYNMILMPGTTESAEFADGRITLRALRLEEGARLTAAPLSQAHDLLDVEFRVVAVRRGEEVFVPKGDDHLQVGDDIFVVLEASDLQRFINSLHPQRRRVERLFLYGANEVGVPLARRVETEVSDVLLIDPDPDACEYASQNLSRTSVIHGSALDEALLEDLKVGNAGHFLALTDSDENNLAAALHARRQGVSATVMLTGDPDRVSLFEPLPVGAVVAPLLLSVGAILRLVRKGRVISLFSLAGDRAEALEVVVAEGASEANKPIRDIAFPPGVVAAAVLGESGPTVARGDTPVRPGDRVVLFALKSACDSAVKLFSAS